MFCAVEEVKTKTIKEIFTQAVVIMVRNYKPRFPETCWACMYRTRSPRDPREHEHLNYGIIGIYIGMKKKF